MGDAEDVAHERFLAGISMEVLIGKVLAIEFGIVGIAGIGITNDLFIGHLCSAVMPLIFFGLTAGGFYIVGHYSLLFAR
jgi:hypothetical protein